MEYVIFKTGGKQYKAKIGDTLEVDRLDSEPNKTIQLSEVLLWVGEGQSKVGNPFIDGASINLKVQDHVKGEKVRIAKFKAKARYRKVTGFRSSLTTLKVEAFDIPGISKTKVASSPKPKAAKKIVGK